ncbi:LmbE family protein, partial [bacterium]|nr:LmbE family protein [bacterium]
MGQGQSLKFPFSPVNAAGGNDKAYTNTVYDPEGKPYRELVQINYDHIPAISYVRDAAVQSLSVDCRIAGKSIGYIAGAGDKVPQALNAMGYKVTMLKEEDVRSGKLTAYDAVVTGVRAYNTNEWMSDAYDALMAYVHNGGVLLVQYNTSNFISQVKSRIGPYDF